MKNPCVERGLFRGCAGAAKEKGMVLSVDLTRTYGKRTWRQ